MSIQTGDNKFGVAKWIVDPVPGQGTNTTIASALAAASSGDTIFIRDGTYTENLTLVPGVNLVSWQASSYTPTVIIEGKCTFTGVGDVSISGISLQTNSDYFLSVTGAADSEINLIGCELNCLNHTGILFSATSGSVSVYNCIGNVATTGITLYECTGTNGIYFQNTNITNSGNSVTPSNHSSGAMTMSACYMGIPFSTSGNAQFVGFWSSFFPPAVCITTSGTNPFNGFSFCVFISNPDASVSIGTGTTVALTHCTIQSSATNTLTGAGTLKYAALAFVGTSSGHNVTTETAIPTL